jgi:lipopolysaccharide transport system permease protein
MAGAERLAPPVFEAADNRLISPRHSLQDVVRHRTFLAYWVKRNILARYRQTTLGPLWALLLPILSGVVYAIVFGIFIGLRPGVPYAVFAITNLVLWGYATRTILTGPAALLGNLDLITRMRFPREILPIGVWLESLTDLALGGVAVAMFFVYYDVPVTRYMWLAPLVFAVFTMLVLGATFLASAVSISVRDLTHAMPVILQLLLYMAPVIYPSSIVPEAYRSLYLLNPLAVIFAAFEETLFLGRFTLGAELAVSAGISVAMLAGGYRLFKRQEWKLADLL